MLPTIKHGDVGDLVRAAQLLTKFSKLNEATGQFSADFVAHIVSWQTAHKCTPDGIIGPKTWTAIADDAPTCSTSKNKTSVFTQALQILLDGANLTEDGVYGTRTKNAVAAFQASAGLKADGICGPKTWHALIVGYSSNKNPTDSDITDVPTVDTDGTHINRCVHYLQWDSRWKNVKYSTHTSSQTIGNSGCGPTAMAQIMATWVNDKITPVEMAKLSVENGFRKYSNGTSWEFFKFVFEKYKSYFSKFVQTSGISTLKAALSNGALAVCSMNSNDNGYWTKGG